jgi:hypothetical protein
MDSKKITNEKRVQVNNQSGNNKKQTCIDSAKNLSSKNISNPVKGLTLTLYKISG